MPDDYNPILWVLGTAATLAVAAWLLRFGVRRMWSEIQKWRAAKELWEAMYLAGDPRTRPQPGRFFNRSPEFAEPSLLYFTRSWTPFSTGVVATLAGALIGGSVIVNILFIN